VGGEDPEVERFLSTLERRLHHVRLLDSAGPVTLANAALGASAGADVVLLASHALVFDGWLERLSDAARSDTTVGTASALGNNAGLLSVWGPWDPIPGDVSLERVAADIARLSPRARPRIPSADGHCVWISREVLDLAGPLDDSFRSLRAAVIDLSQRGVNDGLLNVAADDLFVASALPGLSAHGGSLAVGDDRPLLERRYPYLREALEQGGQSGPLLRSVSLARRALRKLTVTVDARIVRGSFSGAHAQTLQLIEMLHRMERVDVRVLLDPAIGQEALATLDRLPQVQRVFAGDEEAQAKRTDIVHRPYQVSSAEDLELLPKLGERLVVNQLDLIAFHNPGYFPSFQAWQHYRRVTRQALAMADQVVFLSHHAADDAVREELVEVDRARVVPMLPAGAASIDQRRPPGAPDGDFLICIGNDFRHKNRLFALKLLGELLDRGWDGRLVLVGAHVEHGSSAGDEARYLSSRTELAARVHELPAVNEEEKAWLYARASAVVYPTVYEGFGLIPFEAASAGTPCLFAARASLREVFPEAAAVLVPWDPVTSAHRALPLLRDGEERRAHLELVAETARRVGDWESIASALVDTYDRAMRMPFREASALAAEARVQEAEIAKWISPEASMGELVGPDAYLPTDVQRALLAAATRRRLRRPLFALLRVLYRLARRAGRS